MMHDILHDKEMDMLLDNCYETSGGIYNQLVTSDDQAPSTERIYKTLGEPKLGEVMSN